MAKTVRRIEARKPVSIKRLRVAAYARVSMDSERLEHSLSTQISRYSELIQQHPGWEYYIAVWHFLQSKKRKYHPFLSILTATINL